MKNKILSFFKHYWSLFVLLILIGALGYNWKYQIDRKENLLENGVRTKGTSHKKGKNLVWEYVVHGEKFTKIKRKPFKGVWNAEQFEIAYNPNDIEDIAIDYSKFILKGNYTKTKSIGLNIYWMNKSQIHFEYKVGNIKHKRIQKLNTNNEIDLTKNYLVKYQDVNPQIAYIFLDSIVK
ncbi:hypothetical protein G1J88_11715 [Tenacibaculum dicentrarchi]|nr:hypothetical protein [Tenacibaculum dicentrarchi]MCD8421182.1 hypothetical protein [Tenacibaculum dicentrarchi]MCG8829047.1 hypothetical protein [Tenacibaculum dicentrarchi]WBX67944.1 hypothetical protein PG910_07350 [Tenacibaculum dicentrarchi]